MGLIVVIVLVFFVLAGGLGTVAYLTYKRKLRRAKAIERGLKMVPILIHLPPPSSDTAMGNRDVREVVREKTAQAEVLYNLIAGTATEGFKSKFYGQRHLGLEVVATGGLVHFYAVVPVALVSVVKKALQTAYPGARLEEVEDHNIFNQEGRLAATMGGEMVLRAESAYPIATYEQLERDPMEALLTTTSALGKNDGVALQIMVRPAASGWTKRSVALAESKRKGRGKDLGFTAADLVQAAIKAPRERAAEGQAAGGGASTSNLELSEIERIEEKTKHPGFEILVRVLVSTDSVARSQQLLRDIATVFALFEAPGLNGFRFLPALDVQGLVTAFIFRFFPPEINRDILNSAELATLFHLPDSQFTPSASVERQQTKQVDGPIAIPAVGLLFGYNEFRGVRKEIRLSTEDRRRHTYILGQTGTGKSTMLENLAVQDMVNGNGFAFIDPHGDSAEKLLALVPKERAEDVIYFNPADTEYPLGLNLFEFSDPMQKDFLIQETIGMLYRLYDPGHTGIIGPRYEHWYRNAALTLMSDPNGSSFIEIPKVFTDTEYLKQKFKYLRDPTVIDFWTKEMGQTSDYHKSEMLGWFVSKFGAFQNNEMMRNIIGQTKSSFNLRDVMDRKKILIVNLSKGRVGELNSQLLGMIFVIKFQAAAMSRADVPEEQRPDFSLYVDEFQNFSTDSFASILSEARKYRLNLVVANQFIGQLSPEIRDSVFGNIGTIVAHRMGPEDAEFMVKQFAPVFDVGDLVNIPNFNAVMRLMVGGLPSQPFSIKDSAPLGVANLELGLAIKQLSAAKFGRARPQVEMEIMERLEGRAPVAPPAVASASTVGLAGVPAAGASVVATPGIAVMAGALGAPVVAATAAPAVAPTVAPAPVVAPSTVMPSAPAVAVSPIPAAQPSVAPAIAPMQPSAPAPVVSPQAQVGVSAQPIATGLPPLSRDPATLSVADITGGKPPGPRPVDLANVPLMAGSVMAPEPEVKAVQPTNANGAYANVDMATVAPLPAEPSIAQVPAEEVVVDRGPSTAGLPEGVTFVGQPNVEQPVAQQPIVAEQSVGVAPAADAQTPLVPEITPAPAVSVSAPAQPVAAVAVAPVTPEPPVEPVVVAAPAAAVAPEPIPESVSVVPGAPAPTVPPLPLAASVSEVPVESPPAPATPSLPPALSAPLSESATSVPEPIAPVPSPEIVAAQMPEQAPPAVSEQAAAAVLAPSTPAAPELPPSSPGPSSPVSEPELESVPATELEQPAVVAPPTPEPAPTAASPVSAQIEKAEHEIDDLLSTSLIHPNETPENNQLVDLPKESSSTETLASSEEPKAPVAPEVLKPAETTEPAENGLKVIQPLEPIAPSKEALAQELEKPDETGTVQPPVAESVVEPEPVPPAPKLTTAEAPPAQTSAPSTEIIRHQGQMMGIPPVLGTKAAEGESSEAGATELDNGLPPPESLAVDDVARARAEREAEAKLPKSKPAAVDKEPAAPTPQASAAAAKPAQQPAAEDHRSTGGKRKRRRRGGGGRSDAPATQSVAAQSAAAEANSEAQAQVESRANVLAGKLILPSGDKPMHEEVVPKLEKPKKLAPGEVFVDEKGNVMIGE